MVIKPLLSNLDQSTLREFFATPGLSSLFGPWGQMMIDLLAYLEREAEAPAQWARISGGQFVLAEQETDVKGRVLVAPYPLKSGMESYKYGVYYRLAKPWRLGEGIADDAVSAGELVVEGLSRAVRFESDER